MSTRHDQELLDLEDEAAAAASGGASGLASSLAGVQSDAMGAGVADRYTQIGARWLADPVPTRLDPDLIGRLTRMGFRRESLADVRIHRGTKAQQAADALGARAFAVGDQDIFFGQGQFDPASRSGRAVLAHELAHVAPPTGAGGNAPVMGGGMPSSFGGAPMLNESGRGDNNAADSEEHERQAREAEGRVYAQDDQTAMPSAGLPDAPVSPNQSPMAEKPAKIDPQQLEAKVLSILAKFERSEIERAGAF